MRSRSTSAFDWLPGVFVNTARSLELLLSLNDWIRSAGAFVPGSYGLKSIAPPPAVPLAARPLVSASVGPSAPATSRRTVNVPLRTAPSSVPSARVVSVANVLVPGPGRRSPLYLRGAIVREPVIRPAVIWKPASTTAPAGTLPGSVAPRVGCDCQRVKSDAPAPPGVVRAD